MATEKGLPKPFGGTKDVTIPENPIPMHVLEQAKLTSTLGSCLRCSKDMFSIEVDDSMNVRANPYYTPFFVHNDKRVSIPMRCEGEKIGFNMEEEVIEIVRDKLIPGGCVKELVIEKKNVDYYKENAVEVFILEGKLWLIL